MSVASLACLSLCIWSLAPCGASGTLFTSHCVCIARVKKKGEIGSEQQNEQRRRFGLLHSERMRCGGRWSKQRERSRSLCVARWVTAGVR